MYSEEEKKAIIKFLKGETRICKESLCGTCNLNDFCGFRIKKCNESDMYEAVKTVEKWADANPPKTNYDIMKEKLGAFMMSNIGEKDVMDMAIFINDAFPDTPCKYCHHDCQYTCKSEIAKWLEQEAEE